MPELPEVETIKEDLREHVVGAKVERAELLDRSLVEHPKAGEFERRLEGVDIIGARRRAKHLVVELGSGDSLVFQLKIGGQFLLVPPVEEPTSSLMLVLHLDGARRVFLRDETGYTRAQIYTAEELSERFADLGPEPFSEGFTSGYLKEKVGGRRARIKPLLLDQKVVSGVGNIYVDELLFDAKVHPRRKANSFSDEEWEEVHSAISGNLRAGIEHRGTTFSLYRDLLGRKGSHQNHLKVFLREGGECPRCGVKIVKEKVGGRATFLCPACQREDGSGDNGQLELL
ncbi:MAG: bifunctional DNA-formamidopyrimidine glycosylase/DNA-(apurinic or apyrimidinic site) lyase [Rubrobacter sp.]|jgi:formamidopyrimidine-DNA glycosylase|nr:bifunctional DNA-formamidopyrimidine glycosylase/DNA-(apurinic or apyrimidinic site) lyase [Rubrobacter sp.]